MKKIVIAGPGRAGTTFLVYLFTKLNFKTGLSLDDFPHKSNGGGGGEGVGLERNDVEVVKDPRKTYELPKGKKVDLVRHVIVCLRDIDQTLKSRESMGGLLSKAVCEGLAKGHNTQDERSFMLTGVACLLWWCCEHDIPVTLTWYPRILLDSNYAYEKLRCLMKDGLCKEDFISAHESMLRRDMVHVYGPELQKTAIK